jgi:hypothetical protein
MGTQVDLSCPQCGERVPDSESYTVGQHHAPHQRATCPHCHEELIRPPDLEDSAWMVENTAPVSDEELGAGD